MKTSYNGIDLPEDYVKAARDDGVTEKDFELWWGLSREEQRVLNEEADTATLAMYMDFTDKGLTSDEATREIRKFRPIYGNPVDRGELDKIDAPLPFELTDRINKYIIKMASEGKNEKFKREFRKYSTFNAFVREKVKKGEI